MSTNLPTHVQIVFIGGGVAGASTAHHLAKLGRKDAIVLERHRLTLGTTWHAAGFIMQLPSTHAMTQLARHSVELYSSLEAETRQATGLKQNGALGVCRTKDRLFETRKLASIVARSGIEAQIINAGEGKAIYVPKDEQTNPADTTMLLVDPDGLRPRGAGELSRRHSGATLARAPAYALNARRCPDGGHP